MAKIALNLMSSGMKFEGIIVKKKINNPIKSLYF